MVEERGKQKPIVSVRLSEFNKGNVSKTAEVHLNETKKLILSCKNLFTHSFGLKQILYLKENGRGAKKEEQSLVF